MQSSAPVKICIVGLGYVGIPLALQFARSGVEVLGLDIDREKVDLINAGKSYIGHVTAEARAVASGEQTESA